VSHIEEFRAAMRNAGIAYDGPIRDDGRLHRIAHSGRKDDSGFYVLHPPNPIAGGYFGCWSILPDGQNWRQANGVQPQGADFAAVKKMWAEAARQRQADDLARHERFALKAADYFSDLAAPSPEHGYLAAKNIVPHGPVVINRDGDLALPLRDLAGKTWSYQTIAADGEKLFMPGGRVAGCFFPVSDRADGPLIICEGYATGVTIHEATGYATFCAMNCGNLVEVAKAARAQWKERTILIAADNDRFTTKSGQPYNPGVEHAKKAAAVVRASIAIPNFAPDSTKGSDFNDLANQSGPGIVRAQLESALGTGLGQRIRIKDLLEFVPGEDADCVLGDRFLCRGGSCVIVGQTSAGKSSLGMQMAILWALGLDFFCLKPKRPLKSLYIQAENDVGDTAEMFQGILLGLGLVDPNNEEANNALVKVLEKNLVIVRDQTHIGPSFPGYARKMVELHKPDLVWCDPLLSFFGDDINDQQAMSLFLRSELNPISELTGIIWMMLHHTGKPSKDASKTQKSWSSRDFAYMGLGSSELSNWARAIITVVNQSEDEFRVIFAKRGWRSGIRDDNNNPATELNLAHSGDRICWKRIPKPKADDEMTPQFQAFANTITAPTTSSDIIKAAAVFLKRGERTCWKFWDGGQGPLGSLFHQMASGKWIAARSDTASLPYSDA